jgi:hypothetical protein
MHLLDWIGLEFVHCIIFLGLIVLHLPRRIQMRAYEKPPLVSRELSSTYLARVE